MSILEPFIDTIVICTITGLVILSSGVWMDKFENEFQRADMSFVSGTYTEADADDVASLFSYLSGEESTTRSYSGQIELSNGVPQNNEAFTLIAARSLAENTYSRDGELISGTLNVVDGQLEDLSVVVTGDSLLHSVPLTTQAFTRGSLVSTASISSPSD